MLVRQIRNEKQDSSKCMLLHYKSQYWKSYSVLGKLVNRKAIVSKDGCVSFQVWVCEV